VPAILLMSLLLVRGGWVWAQEAGVKPVPGQVFAAGKTLLDDDHRVTHTGVLRYWRAYSTLGGRVMLKVFRLESDRLVLVGASPLVSLSPGEPGTFECRIPVSRGDLIGCFCPDTNCVDRLEGGGALLADGDAGTGPSSRFSSEVGGPSLYAGASQAFDARSPASANLVVPVVSRGPGAGQSNWITSLELFNTSDEEAVVALYFNLSDVDNTQPAASSRIRLPARGTMRIEDLLLDSFGISQACGSLDIVASAPILAHARILNTGSETGTFGQAIPAVPACWALGDDSASGLSPHTGTGSIFVVLENGDWRTNIGVANVSGSPLDVRIDAFEKTTPLGSTLWISLPAYSHTQVNRILSRMGLVSPQREIRLEISAADGSAGRFLAYASRVDNHSGDASYIPAESEPVLEKD